MYKRGGRQQNSRRAREEAASCLMPFYFLVVNSDCKNLLDFFFC